MASSGWIRVAAGMKLVASAAAKHATVEAGSAATRTARHAVDLGANLRAVAALQQSQPGPEAQEERARSPPINGAAAAAPSAESKEQEVSPKKDDFEDLLFHAARAKSTKPPEVKPLKSTEAPPKPSVYAREKELIDRQAKEEKEEPIIHKEANPKKIPMQEQQPSNDIPDDLRLHTNHDNHQRLQEGKAVPSTRVGRAFGFASLGVGLAVGTLGEAVGRLTGTTSTSGATSVVVNNTNADRLAASLCRMRGAALKMGQMLSIQDESLLPPELTRALKQVRQGADAMPEYQLVAQLKAQLGENWPEKFESFDKRPFAAASVGQCHRATIRQANGTLRDVVVKVQYPGVGRSIESDLQNLAMMVQWTGMAPKGLFLDNVIRVGQEELKVECDYLRELEQQQRMKELVQADPILQENKFVVPDVYPHLTTQEVITTAYSPGGTIDKVSFLDQDERNRIARTILYLTIQELFDWRFMQTDPNWGNFLYDVGTQTTSLIDFGATRDYSKDFVDGYLRIVWASAQQDEERLMAQSYKMGFLTGEENEIMLNAHKQSGYTVGEPFRTHEPFDFRGSQLSTRMGQHTSAFLKHRLTPPPSEVYTLHRKLAGAFMLCIKLGAVIRCRDLLEDVVANHGFEDGQDPPPL